MKVAFVMVMGPGESSMAIDNLEAIHVLYPEAQSWVRDDATIDGSWETLKEWSKGKRVHLSRNPHAYGYMGISRTFGELLLEVASSRPGLVIKIDPDTMLLGAGLDSLLEGQFMRYGNGVCGSYRYSPEGHRRPYWRHRLKILLDALPFGPKKKMQGMRWRTVGYFPFLIRALRHGYRPGENVQGGLYGIEGSILEKLVGSGFLHAMAYGPSGMVSEEDVLIALGVKAVGGSISPLNNSLENGPTHIQFARPLSLTRERLASPDLLAVHPVKPADQDLRSSLLEMRIKRWAGVD